MCGISQWSRGQCVVSSTRAFLDSEPYKERHLPERQEKDYSRKNVMLQDQRLGVLFTVATSKAFLGESVPQQGHVGRRTARAAKA